MQTINVSDMRQARYGINILLVKPGPWTKNDVIAVNFVVQQSRGDDQGRPIAARIVELARGLGGARDDVHVNEARFTGDLVVPVRHGNHDSFVQAENQVRLILTREGVEEPDFKRSRIGEQEPYIGRLHLRDHQFAAGPGHSMGGRRQAIVRSFRSADDCGNAGRTDPQRGKAFHENASR